MGCAASTNSAGVVSTPPSAAVVPADQPHGRKEVTDDTGRATESADLTKQQPHPQPPSVEEEPTSITVNELISGGLLLLSIAADHCPLPGASAIAGVLKSIYAIFNSAQSKSEWMAEFMVRSTTHRRTDDARLDSTRANRSSAIDPFADVDTVATMHAGSDERSEGRPCTHPLRGLMLASLLWCCPYCVFAPLSSVVLDVSACDRM
jgi:hypothetical protein